MVAKVCLTDFTTTEYAIVDGKYALRAFRFVCYFTLVFAYLRKKNMAYI